MSAYIRSTHGCKHSDGFYTCCSLPSNKLKVFKTIVTKGKFFWNKRRVIVTQARFHGREGRTNGRIFCTYQWPRLSPPLTTIQHIIYF